MTKRIPFSKVKINQRFQFGLDLYIKVNNDHAELVEFPLIPYPFLPDILVTVFD